MRTYIVSALAGVFALGLATAAFAAAGQFDNMCSWGLANHKDVKTDCSVNTIDQGQDLLLQQPGGQGRLHEGSRRQSRQGRVFL